MKMSKVDYVKYIELGASKLTELQKGTKLDYGHKKFILRKAAQELLAITYQKALNFAVDVLSPIGDDLQKVANRFKGSELEVIANYIDSEILRVQAVQAEKEEKVERTVFFSEQEKNHHEIQKAKKAEAVAVAEVQEKKEFETVGGLNRSLQSTLGKHYKLSKFIQDGGLSFYSLFDEVRISFADDFGRVADIDEKVMEHLGAYHAKIEIENKGNAFEKKIITVSMKAEEPKQESTYMSYEDGDSYISTEESNKIVEDAMSRTANDIKFWVMTNAPKILWHQDNITYRTKTMIAIFQGEKSVNDYGISQLVTLFFEAKKELDRLVDIGGGN